MTGRWYQSLPLSRNSAISIIINQQQQQQQKRNIAFISPGLLNQECGEQDVTSTDMNELLSRLRKQHSKDSDGGDLFKDSLDHMKKKNHRSLLPARIRKIRSSTHQPQPSF